jgi:hypothetical protein
VITVLREWFPSLPKEHPLLVHPQLHDLQHE